MRHALALALATLLIAAVAHPDPGNASSVSDAYIDAPLMNMGIQSTSDLNGVFQIETLGSVVTLDASGMLRVRQRIGIDREILSIQLDAHFAPWSMTAATPFLCTLAGNGLRITVQGDSVLIFEASQNMRLPFSLHFSPVFNAHERGNRLLLDKQGGCGVFGIPPRTTELTGSDAERSLLCHLARWDQLWISICPPRPEDPKRLSQSISHDILYYLMKDDAMTERYPSRATLQEIAKHCQVLALHEEVWRDAPAWVDDPPGSAYEHPKPWETDRHEPFDTAEFNRMRDDAHAVGLQVVAYCSPYYCNAPDIFAEMKRVLDEYKLDGLYFDGWCPARDDFRVGYDMMRRARAMLGDKILYLHSSGDPFGSVSVYPPFVMAYADFSLRGESGRGDLDRDTFLRYAVSGHQISNSVGVWCHYGSTGQSGYQFVVPPTDDIEAALRNHVQLWRQSRMWARNPQELARFDREYYPALERALKIP